MLRGTEMSKMDSEVLSNYDDKKTVLSSYLIKQMIAKAAANGTEFDNSITSEQEMWQVKLKEKQDITEFSILEQEEGVKMQPIKLKTGKVEEETSNVILEQVILKKNDSHDDRISETNGDWSFSEVADFYSSVYPHQFGDNGEVEKLGLMIVDFSTMNLQKLSEIHIPKLIKIEIPNADGYYDKHWFIPVAMKTPIINKSILIDAPSVLVINPVPVAKSGEEKVDHYESDKLGVSHYTTEENGDIYIDENGTYHYPKTFVDINITQADGSYIETTSSFYGTRKYASGKILKNGMYIIVTLDDPEDTGYYANEEIIKYKANAADTEHVLRLTEIPESAETIDVRIRVSQFTCGETSKVVDRETIVTLYPLKATVSSKLVVETINHFSNPSAFVAENEIGVLSCAYTDGVANGAYTLPIPSYYKTVCLEKLDRLGWKDVYDRETKMILCRYACVIVPKGAKIDVDYTQMQGGFNNFNIIVLEPSYLLKMEGPINRPINRHKYLNMEEYLMELPYRHYNNMLMDKLMTRTYENYDQTYKLVVEKNYDTKTFKYNDYVTPLAIRDTKTGIKTVIDKYYLASHLVDENQKILNFDGVSRLKIGVEKIMENGEVKPIEINISENIYGFDVLGLFQSEADAKVEIEVPIIDLGKNTVFMENSDFDTDNKKPLLKAENVIIHSDNFINYFNEDTKEGDVIVRESDEKIIYIPTHIHSQDVRVTPPGYGPNQVNEVIPTIPATIKIDTVAIGPHIKTASIRDKMVATENVDSPITLYTFGEAGWSKKGKYITTADIVMTKAGKKEALYALSMRLDNVATDSYSIKYNVKEKLSTQPLKDEFEAIFMTAISFDPMTPSQKKYNLLTFENIDKSNLSSKCKAEAKAALEEILKDNTPSTSVKANVAAQITNSNDKSTFNSAFDNPDTVLTLGAIEFLIASEPANIFAKVLIPSEGLEDFSTKEAEWKTAFAHMLRLVDESAIEFY